MLPAAGGAAHTPRARGTERHSTDALWSALWTEGVGARTHVIDRREHKLVFSAEARDNRRTGPSHRARRPQRQDRRTRHDRVRSRVARQLTRSYMLRKFVVECGRGGRGRFAAAMMTGGSDCVSVTSGKSWRSGVFALGAAAAATVVAGGAILTTEKEGNSHAPIHAPPPHVLAPHDSIPIAPADARMLKHHRIPLSEVQGDHGGRVWVTFQARASRVACEGSRRELARAGWCV